MANQIVVTVDRSRTVTVERHTPSISTVVETSAVTTLPSPAARVHQVDVEQDTPEIVEIPRGPAGPAGPPGEGDNETFDIDLAQIYAIAKA